MQSTTRIVVKILLVALSLPLLFACGTMERLAPSVAGDLLQKGQREMETERNYEVFRESALPNLKFIEGILYVNPSEENLLASLTKGYASYAVLVSESELLEVKLAIKKQSRKREDEEYYKKRAIDFYTRAQNYGLRFLKLQGVSYEQLLAASSEELAKLLDQNLDGENSRDLDAIFFLAQAWAGLINLQKERPRLMGQLPLVKSLFDWVCLREPNYFFGGCMAFNGAYEVSRPPLLGGNPQKGLQLFQQGIEKNRDNLFLQVALIEYALIPLEEKELFQKQMAELKSAIQRITAYWEESTSSSYDPHQNLLNALAMKHYNVLKQYDKTIFE
ncbi:MAG: hypothetical protein HQK50_06070 [Oligoflexia bacterium]|nr:hypothetical protein [Oligoflexia bacterium]MBF0365117.1 hypothetical protein [Oligoflexia bacterium]